MSRCSVLLDSEAVGKVQESGLSFTILVVAEAQSALHVVGLTTENLEFVVLAHDEFDELSSTFLEFRNTVLLAFFFQNLNNFWHVTFGPSSKVLLWQFNLVEAERVNNIDDLRCVIIFFDNIIRSDLDLIATLGNHTGLDLIASVVIDQFMRVGVGEELVFGD